MFNTEQKVCQNCKTSFTIDASDFAFYEKMKVPPPTWCSLCRFQRRALFRNERKLFRAKSALSGKDMLSLFPPESGYTLYRHDEWRSDAWDPLTYGQEVDFSRLFLAQLHELDAKVPKPNGSVLAMIQSEYCDNASYLKNCYLLFNSNRSEDSAYGNGVDESRFCFDNSHIQQCERCYNSFWLTKCYETHFSSRCDDCTNMWFSKDCRGCSNCVGCVNLRAKKYCIFNTQYSKNEYFAKLEEMKLNMWSGMSRVADAAHALWLRFPNKYLQGVHNTNVNGGYITHSKNVFDSYLIRDCEDMRYVQYSQVPSSKDCYDGSVIGSGAELMYEASVCGWGAANIRFSWECWDTAHDMEYCMFSNTSSHLFGCVGVQKKQYCILNKQYSPEDFFALREKIIRHMDEMPYVDKQGRTYRYGEFFPPEFSPFAYTQTITPEHFPFTKEEAAAAGFRWQDPNPTEYQTTMNAEGIPDAIGDVSETILKETIRCAACSHAYRLIPSELLFLKERGIPAPRQCIDCRHMARVAQRSKAIFYQRQCGCSGIASADNVYQNTAEHFHGASSCPNTFQTVYAPERPEIVYCEQCYQSEVV